MTPLIQSGLMYGNLIHVDSPALVDRYNRALKHLTGKTTQLSDFHIDISGFSPEIGDELGDPLYLNQGGCNRQFILLSTRQKTAPLLDATFSTSRSILRQFIDANDTQLFALTARDAVAGELVNSVFSVKDPERLLDIRRITVQADTTTGTLRDADQLGQLSDRFLKQEDAWFDDALIDQMITIARRTGDISRNPVRLTHATFKQDNYWTSHFGGLYLFRGTATPAILASGQGAESLDPIPLGERNRVAKFLTDNALVEPIVKARGVDAAAILRQKMDFIVVDTAQHSGIDLTGATRRDLHRIARIHADQLPEEYHALRRLTAWAEEDGDWPRISSAHPAYFYTLRAADTPDRDLVNMLLAELTPKDIRQLFICHKHLFYKAYHGWSETKQAYVIDFLKREYMADKAGARAVLFGHDAPMSEPLPSRTGPWSKKPAPQPKDDLIARVGPWGALRRERD